MRGVGREIPLLQVASREPPATSGVIRLSAIAPAARSSLGWKPRVTLEEGLTAIVDFVRRHPDRFRPLKEYA